MKIRAVRLQNLTSLAGTWEIDFTQPPLRDAGLFAITGRTGAGKSTILDAICLALYGKTPRTTGQGRKFGGDDDLLSGDPRGFMTRGATDALAEVDFEDRLGQVYRATWQCRRARTGTLQQSQMALIDLTTDTPLGHKKREVEKAIEHRVGLNYDQFTRSVLLAQGDFAAFLKADGRERAELLEKLTGTDIYARISQAAFQRAKAEDVGVKEVRLRIEALHLREPEELEEQARRREEAGRELAVVEKALDADRTALEWHRRLAVLREEQQHAQEAFAAAQQRLAEAAPVETQLNRWRRVLALRPLLDERERLRRELEAGRAALAEREGERSTRERDLEAAQAAAATSAAAEERAAQALDAASPRLREARALDVQLGERRKALEAAQKAAEEEQAAVAADQRRLQNTEARAKSMRDQQKAVADELTATAAWAPLGASEGWRDRIDAVEGALQENQAAQKAYREALRGDEQTREALQQEQAALDDIDGELTAAREGLHELEQVAREADVGGVEAALTRQRERLDVLHEVRESAREVVAARQTRDELSQAIIDAKGVHETAAERQRQIQRELHVCGTSLQRAEEELERIRTFRQFDVARRDLVEGVPCPLCGAEHHPYAEQTPEVGDVEAAEHTLAAVRERHRNLEREAAAVERDAATAQVRRADLEARLPDLETELAAALETWEALPSREGFPASPGPGTVGEATTAITETKASIRELTAKLEKIRQQQKQFNAARERADALRQALDAAQERVRQAEQPHQQASNDLFIADRQARKTEDRLKDARLRLSEVVPEDIPQEILSEPDALRRYCDERVAARRTLEERQQRLTDGLRELEVRLQEQRAVLAEREADAAKSALAAKSLADERSTLERERRSFFDGKDADEVEAALKRDLDHRRAAARKAAEGVQQVAQALASLEATTSDLRQRAEATESRHGDALRAFEAACREREMTPSAVEELLARDQAWAEDQQQTLQGLKDAVARAESVARERQRTLQTHDQERPTEEAAEQLEARLQERKEQVKHLQHTIAEIAALLKAEEARRQERATLEITHEKRLERWRLWQNLSELIGSSDGKKFRTIAQHYTLEVLLGQANAHLRELAPRYLLEPVPDQAMEIRVIDRDMGDEIRSVNSLSGGESFLVSLALALGLSSLAAERTPIRSLFIDEGFGSLDAESLEVALASLDVLQSRGRQVGVISHVGTMVERIGVQIRVTPTGGGRSSVEVDGM